jgi:hypothetical protein
MNNVALLWAMCGVLSLGGICVAEEYYVAPNGKRDAAGTKDAPWDIESALAGKQATKPGDTIWIRGGTYKHPTRTPGTKGYTVQLKGEKEKPIHVRGYTGERATIDGGLTVVAGTAYLWMWDLEILVSENLTGERKTAIGGSGAPTDLPWPWGGVEIQGGTGCKYIGLVIHDNGQGCGFWKGAVDSELVGCLIYNNGWVGPDRWHGPGLYTQNQTGTKLVTDNVIFGNYSNPIQCYGSKNAFVDNYVFDGNIVFAPKKGGGRGTFLVGGGAPSHNITVRNSVTYECPIQIGYGAENEDCIVEGNTIIRAGLNINKYKKAEQKDNLIWTQGNPLPAKPLIFLRPSKYDAKRANLAIVNLAKAASVPVDMATFLKAGEKYRILDTTDFFGKPVLEGAFDGQPVAVSIAPTPENGQGEFGAFVVLRQ